MSRNVASRWDPLAYAVNAGFVPALGMPALALLAPCPGERILDVGCGDGALTAQIAATGASVVGLDASPEMVSAARVRGLDARVQDCQSIVAAEEFDAAFSNAALHWMLDPAAVADGVFRALRAGGRYAGEMGGVGNIAILRAGLRKTVLEMGFNPPAEDPQWYPDVAEFQAVHSAAGFVDIQAQLINRPTPLPNGLVAWFTTFRAGFLDTAGVPPERRDELAERAAARVEPRLSRDADGVPLADYVRLRFHMRKPA